MKRLIEITHHTRDGLTVTKVLYTCYASFWRTTVYNGCSTKHEHDLQDVDDNVGLLFSWKHEILIDKGDLSSKNIGIQVS